MVSECNSGASSNFQGNICYFYVKDKHPGMVEVINSQDCNGDQDTITEESAKKVVLLVQQTWSYQEEGSKLSLLENFTHSIEHMFSRNTQDFVRLTEKGQVSERYIQILAVKHLLSQIESYQELDELPFQTKKCLLTCLFKEAKDSVIPQRNLRSILAVLMYGNTISEKDKDSVLRGNWSSLPSIYYVIIPLAASCLFDPECLDDNMQKIILMISNSNKTASLTFHSVWMAMIQYYFSLEQKDIFTVLIKIQNFLLQLNEINPVIAKYLKNLTIEQIHVIQQEQEFYCHSVDPYLSNLLKAIQHMLVSEEINPSLDKDFMSCFPDAHQEKIKTWLQLPLETLYNMYKYNMHNLHEVCGINYYKLLIEDTQQYFIEERHYLIREELFYLALQDKNKCNEIIHTFPIKDLEHVFLKYGNICFMHPMDNMEVLNTFCICLLGKPETLHRVFTRIWNQWMNNSFWGTIAFVWLSILSSHQVSVNEINTLLEGPLHAGEEQKKKWRKDLICFTSPYFFLKLLYHYDDLCVEGKEQLFDMITSRADDKNFILIYKYFVRYLCRSMVHKDGSLCKDDVSLLILFVARICMNPSIQQNFPDISEHTLTVCNILIDKLKEELDELQSNLLSNTQKYGNFEAAAYASQEEQEIQALSKIISFFEKIDKLKSSINCYLEELEDSMRKAYPDDLTDKEWEQIKPFIAKHI